MGSVAFRFGSMFEIRASSPHLTASTGRTEDCTRPMPLRQFTPCNAGAIHRRHHQTRRTGPFRATNRHGSLVGSRGHEDLVN